MNEALEGFLFFFQQLVWQLVHSEVSFSFLEHVLLGVADIPEHRNHLDLVGMLPRHFPQIVYPLLLCFRVVLHLLQVILKDLNLFR